MYEAQCRIIKIYVPRFIHKENSYTMVTYHNYFYDTVLRLKKKDRKESILGVLSTMCLCEDHIETHNVRRSLMSSSK